MASIRREAILQAPMHRVWEALRDVGALHTRLAPGFITDTKLDGEARIVTFGNGMVVRELIVDIDESQQRVSWAVVGTALTHHNASFQLFDEGSDRTRGVWIADFLPHEAAPRVAAMIEEGLAAMKRTFG